MDQRARPPMLKGVGLALAAAVTFGLTTPLVARAAGGLGAFTVAALLYAGAGLAALALRPFAGRRGRPLARHDAVRLVLVAVSGAVLAPSLYAAGLRAAGPTATSLTLNLEAVFTALLAGLLYREPIGGRIALALALMVGGGVLASQGAGGGGSLLGVALVAGATAAWAADNALSRSLADADPGEVVLGKSLLGVAATGPLALLADEPGPGVLGAVALLALGATGYGLSLRLYLLAQRLIGAARTGSVFAAGPFLGAALAWAMGDRGGATTLWASAAFLAGVVLHATERHGHRHVHPALGHEHAHGHDDAHHHHRHDPPVAGEHSHAHEHDLLEHDHEHAPDLHHGHGH